MTFGGVNNPFYATETFIYPLKTPENLWFSDVFRGIEMEQWIYSYWHTSRAGFSSFFFIFIWTLSYIGSIKRIRNVFNKIAWA